MSQPVSPVAQFRRYVSIIMKMPYRYVFLDFSLDANRINAMKKCPATNQLEAWGAPEVNVISINMCDVAQGEASNKSAKRYQKASQYIFDITLDSHRQGNEFKKIKNILFPNKSTLSPNEENDVLIILHAKHSHCILVTNDGGSKRQPGGMLGNKERILSEIGVTVMRDTEAVKLVEEKIIERDNRARRIAERFGESLPDWVGKDIH